MKMRFRKGDRVKVKLEIYRRGTAKTLPHPPAIIEIIVENPNPSDPAFKGYVWVKMITRYGKIKYD